MDYKDKLKLAKEALDSGSYDKETIEYIFPELAESEDEKIRKALLEYFAEECDTSTINGIYCYKIYAWLEEQGEPKWREEDDSMLYTIIADFKAFKHDNTSTLEPHFNDCITWLESLKQRMEE